MASMEGDASGIYSTLLLWHQSFTALPSTEYTLLYCFSFLLWIPRSSFGDIYLVSSNSIIAFGVVRME